MKLSIIIPCYNEKNTILKILEKIERVNLSGISKEIVIVDDGSTDGTGDLLREIAGVKNYKIFFHDRNIGKGGALRTGFKYASGDIVIVQDADLEYDPEDYNRLIKPIIEGECKVVYGSREKNRDNKNHSGVSFYLGGLFLTWLTNLLYFSDLTDEPTCYKVFDRNILTSLNLQCQKFEFCPEVTAKILKKGIKIKEVPINYFPRKIHEGKKIRFSDGIHATWTLIKFRFVN
jgi:dolichol-phosphate mannosyltransferase